MSRGTAAKGLSPWGDARSDRVDWRTPPEIVQLAREALGGYVVLDPCASRSAAPGEWIAPVNLFGPPDGDGLLADWWEMGAGPYVGPPTVFVNPPYNANPLWVAKVAEEARKGCEVILLIPARTDTAYWHTHVATADAVCLWRGRVRFYGPKGEAENAAPFPVALSYWGKHVSRFVDVFSPHGAVLLRAKDR